jgi:hypothetical protein
MNKSNTWRAVLLLQILAAMALLLPTASSAAQDCEPMQPNGIQRCAAGLSSTQVAQMRATQEQSQWCWAASIAMVFAHHGFSLAQERVVERHFGELANRGVPGAVMTQLLGESWRDAKGRAFLASALVGDAPARRFQFGSDTVVRELADERPLIVGALGHAMVLVHVEYERFPEQDAVRITGGTVIDPAAGQGVRRLKPQELQPSYVAAVRVSQDLQLAAATLAYQ